MEQEFR